MGWPVCRGQATVEEIYATVELVGAVIIIGLGAYTFTLPYAKTDIVIWCGILLLVTGLVGMYYGNALRETLPRQSVPICQDVHLVVCAVTMMGCLVAPCLLVVHIYSLVQMSSSSCSVQSLIPSGGESPKDAVLSCVCAVRGGDKVHYVGETSCAFVSRLLAVLVSQALVCIVFVFVLGFHGARRRQIFLGFLLPSNDTPEPTRTENDYVQCHPFALGSHPAPRSLSLRDLKSGTLSPKCESQHPLSRSDSSKKFTTWEDSESGVHCSFPCSCPTETHIFLSDNG